MKAFLRDLSLLKSESDWTELTGRPSHYEKFRYQVVETSPQEVSTDILIARVGLAVILVLSIVSGICFIGDIAAIV
jgi:hypothetical protein